MGTDARRVAWSLPSGTSARSCSPDFAGPGFWALGGDVLQFLAWPDVGKEERTRRLKRSEAAADEQGDRALGGDQRGPADDGEGDADPRGDQEQGQRAATAEAPVSGQPDLDSVPPTWAVAVPERYLPPRCAYRAERAYSYIVGRYKEDGRWRKRWKT